MLPNFTLYAFKGTEKKKVPCATATEAVRQRLHFLRYGWGVSTSNHIGMPISDANVDAQAREEAGKKVEA